MIYGNIEMHKYVDGRLEETIHCTEPMIEEYEAVGFVKAALFECSLEDDNGNIIGLEFHTDPNIIEELRSHGWDCVDTSDAHLYINNGE